MSTVSFQNESLPSFEPLEHAPQKRKRANMKDVDSQPVIKKSRAKRSVANTPSTKSAVWIGATLKEENGVFCAAFSVYYGLNDARNCTEKIILHQDQNLDHVYALGVIRALEICMDDACILSIHTGSKLLEEELKDDSEILNQVLETISKRKGSTSIRYKASSSDKQDEYNVSHDMAKDKLLENDMMIDEDETMVDSLEMKESKIEVTTTKIETVITTIHEEKVQEDVVQEKITVTVVEEESTSSSAKLEPIAAPSWAYALGLHNLLDILKAPFSRKNKQQ
ncbi:hypothetical protein INT47_001709 [Mucor saturninus]|uniref:Uncharacterized protein n=1 Tax=Mucor saturninus TaxID=64648 RepID=A0A8H7VF98_9FUNG|nr:hypothetical protein INT47_001709 [Mucor saturninus]